MTKPSEIELSTADIRVLAALIYEPVPRVWVNGRWCCPYCLELNARKQRRCACGITRDAAAESFSEEVIASRELDGLKELLSTEVIPEAPPCFLFADHQPPPSAL